MSDDPIEELRQQLSDAQDLIENQERGMAALRAELWDAKRELEKVRALHSVSISVSKQIEAKEAELRAIIRADPETLRLAYARRCDERDELAAWKQSSLTLESWWKRVDDAVRKRADITIGDSVAAVALRLIEERDTCVATELVGQLTNAGTMRVSDEENRTGYFVACTEDELRAVKSLPMYRRVAIVPIAA